MIEPEFSSEEVADLGEAVFERAVAAKLRRHELHHFVAIDVHSGDYEVDADAGLAIHRLLERQPDSRFWLRRVGSRVAHTFGPRLQFQPPWGDD